MKKVFIIFFIHLIGYTAFPQVNIDSLTSLLNDAKGEAYYNLVIEIFDKTEKYYSKNIMNIDHPEVFLNYLNHAHQWVAQHGDRNQKAVLNYNYFNYYHGKYNTSKSISIGKTLLKEKNISTIQYYNVLGKMCVEYRNIKAYTEYLKLIPIKYAYVREHQISGEYNSENMDIGMVYYSMSQYEKSLQYLNKELKDSKSLISELDKSSTLNNIGLIHQKLNRVDSAIIYFDLAIEKAESFTIENESYRKYFIDVIKSNKAKLALTNGDFDVPIPFLKKEITGGLYHNELWTVLAAYNNLANIYILKNNPRLSLKYLDSALMYKDNNLFKNEYAFTLQLKIRALLLLDKFKEANELITYQTYLQDSIKSAENKLSLESAAILYETKKKEDEITLQKLTLAQQSVTIDSQKQERNILIVGLVFLLIIILIVSLFYILIKKAKRKIEIQKEALNEALILKNILFKEIHHRVKNNLQIISGLLHLQSSKSSNIVVKDMMQQGQLRIDAMALIHQMLYQSTNFKSVEIKKYLKDLTNQLASSYPSSKYVAIEINVCNIEIDIDKAVPLGLITNELVTNAYKHAFNDKKGVIEIALHLLENGKYQYQISDNGCGLADNYESKSAESLGMKLVDMLRKELRASLEVNNENGTKFIFELEL